MARAAESEVVAAVRAGDEKAFAGLVERHRRELHVHCYRMLGSLEDSEDLVQETFLRAWRKRESFQGNSTFRAWLYRIATNACLDALAHRLRDQRARGVAPAADPDAAAPPPPEIAWLQPYPDRLLEPIAPSAAEPDAAVVAKETIELAFLVAIQHLSPRQRAVLILRDVLGWPAKETAAALEMSVAAVKSALQRARPELKRHLPQRRADWAPSADPTEEERVLLQRYMDAHERADATAIAGLLSEDARVTMPPYPDRYEGREAIATLLAEILDPGSPGYVGHLRTLPTRANLQPAAAIYLRDPAGSEYRPMTLDVLRIEDAKVVEITAFASALFPAFGLPPTL
ncbi:RNA polymerase subunit sigma-70 [Actinomadura alba]|uniref:RNA polymerase sigma factor n=1 Tax=Actinomadura alba TaxID=406431 RepID=A0ABR7M3F8_9ACTN|nr:RNA polymerase subunit sigma-70 [Actinomadura alba]